MKEKEQKAGLIEMLGQNTTNIEIGEKKYTCRPVDLLDISQFMSEIRAEMMEDVEAKAEKRFKFLKAQEVSEELCVREYTKVIDEGAIDEFKLLSVVKSLRGTRYYFLAGALEAHPELTVKKVEKLITKDNWQSVYRKLDLLKQRSAKNADGGTAPPEE